MFMANNGWVWGAGNTDFTTGLGLLRLFFFHLVLESVVFHASVFFLLHTTTNSSTLTPLFYLLVFFVWLFHLTLACHDRMHIQEQCFTYIDENTRPPCV